MTLGLCDCVGVTDWLGVIVVLADCVWVTLGVRICEPDPDWLGDPVTLPVWV